MRCGRGPTRGTGSPETEIKPIFAGREASAWRRGRAHSAEPTRPSQSAPCLPGETFGLHLPGGGHGPCSAPRGTRGAAGRGESGRGESQPRLAWPRAGGLHQTASPVQNNSTTGVKSKKQPFRGSREPPGHGRQRAKTPGRWGGYGVSPHPPPRFLLGAQLRA